MMSESFDRLASLWERIAHWTGHRPIQLLSYLIGAIILVTTLTYSVTRATESQHQVNQLKSQFCSGVVDSHRNTQLCQRLFNKLIQHPTLKQKQQLRQLLQGGP